MSFMNVSELSREALETTYRLIRTRLFKADAKNDFIMSALQEIQDEKSLKRQIKMFKRMVEILKDAPTKPVNVDLSHTIEKELKP